MSLDDIPKKVQYVVLDSDFVNGTNNTFSLDLTLESNTHVEDMSRGLGIKVVDFYITQIGDSGGSGGGTVVWWWRWSCRVRPHTHTLCVKLRLGVPLLLSSRGDGGQVCVRI